MNKQDEHLLIEAVFGEDTTLIENYPEGYFVTYQNYLYELERRGVVSPAQYFPLISSKFKNSEYRQMLQLQSMEDEMQSLDMWEKSYAENPGGYPNRYTPNEIVELRNGVM